MFTATQKPTAEAVGSATLYDLTGSADLSLIAALA